MRYGCGGGRRSERPNPGPPPAAVRAPAEGRGVELRGVQVLGALVLAHVLFQLAEHSKAEDDAFMAAWPGDYDARYDVLAKASLGEGSFGKVCECVSRATGARSRTSASPRRTCKICGGRQLCADMPVVNRCGSKSTTDRKE